MPRRLWNSHLVDDEPWSCYYLTKIAGTSSCASKIYIEGPPTESMETEIELKEVIATRKELCVIYGHRTNDRG
jgi:hypothetical protein